MKRLCEVEASARRRLLNIAENSLAESFSQQHPFELGGLSPEPPTLFNFILCNGGGMVEAGAKTW